MNITNGWGIKERQIGKKKKRYIDRNIYLDSQFWKKTEEQVDARTNGQTNRQMIDYRIDKKWFRTKNLSQNKEEYYVSYQCFWQKNDVSGESVA